MAKYKIKGTNILHSKKLYEDGSDIELEDKDAEKLRDYLVPIQEKKVNTTKNNDKTTKTTNNTTKTTSEINPEKTEETNKEAK